MLLGMGSRMLTRTRGLGTPTPSGSPQSSFWVNMTPGGCCYDPDRPKLQPSFLATDAEKKCIDATDNCSGATGVIPVTPPPVSACAGTISVDANGNRVCTQVPSVNDPNNTQGGLSTNGSDFTTQWNDWINGMTAGTTLGVDSGPNWYLIGGIAILVVGLIGGGAAGRHLR